MRVGRLFSSSHFFFEGSKLHIFAFSTVAANLERLLISLSKKYRNFDLTRFRLMASASLLPSDDFFCSDGMISQG